MQVPIFPLSQGERGEGKVSRRDVPEMVLMSISELIVQGGVKMGRLVNGNAIERGAESWDTTQRKSSVMGERKF